MSTNFKTVGDACPVAYVAKNKQRVKQYNDTVYLKNGDNFELELYNPTQFKVLAQIELNGVSIGSGIILRPAERVFLERYINEAKKFLFETYEVNGENKEVLKAIEKNGLVSVKFYKESVNFNWDSFTIPQRDIWGGPEITYFNGSTGNHLFGQPITTSNAYYSNLGNLSCGNSNSNLHSDMSGISSISTNYSGNNATFTSAGGQSTNSLRSKKTIETGRIEKGSKSDQNFETVDAKFDLVHSWISEWKLLPESRKLIVAEDLVSYCTIDGRRRRKNEIFCPLCGTKF